MTEIAAKARAFADLHRPGAPLILYNIWDAGSARSVVKAGARAVATGSWSLAGALGFDDGENAPLDLVLTTVARIVASVDAPVSVDFEGGYAGEPRRVEAHAARLFATGAIGVNFEDQMVGGDGIYGVDEQAARIAAVRRAADAAGAPAFVNARTDLFLKAPDDAHPDLVDAAIARAAAYAAAGADGFFVPSLIDEASIAKIVENAPMPVNVMVRDGVPTTARLAELGVARVSHGPGPWRAAMDRLADAAAVALGGA